MTTGVSSISVPILSFPTSFTPPVALSCGHDGLEYQLSSSFKKLRCAAAPPMLGRLFPFLSVPNPSFKFLLYPLSPVEATCI